MPRYAWSAADLTASNACDISQPIYNILLNMHRYPESFKVVMNDSPSEMTWRNCDRESTKGFQFPALTLGRHPDSWVLPSLHARYLYIQGDMNSQSLKGVFKAAGSAYECFFWDYAANLQTRQEDNEVPSQDS